jgi:plastocyanin
VPTQLLVNVLAVGPLAAGASVTLAHNLASNDVSVAPTLVFPDRATPIVVTATTTTTVTFTNAGAGVESANFRCERGWQPEVDAFSVIPLRWQGGTVGGSGVVGYGQFSNSTDQALVAGTPTLVQFNTTDFSVGVTLNALTQLTVAATGTYRFDISLQMLNSGGGGSTIIFWPRLNGTNIPNSASSIEMGNNNNRTLPYVMTFVTLTAGQYVEWVVEASGANTRIEHYPAVVGPPAIPAIPSVIATVTRIA